MDRPTNSLLLVGGTSDIGRATALKYAQAGWSVVLTARDMEAGRRTADDVAVRAGSSVEVLELDILETEKFAEFVDRFSALPHTVVCVVGELGDQVRAQSDIEHARLVLRANFEGPALLLTLLAERFAARRAGTIVGVSSVAGDRGRSSNYVYGAAKAGLTAFLSGLRNRLLRDGVRVLTVKPGFVRTRMTAGIKLPPLLTAEADEVGQAIYSAAEIKSRDVIYVRPVWRAVMTAIRLIPEPLFKRLRL